MNITEFNEVIARINDAYPKKTYGADQLKRLFGEVKPLTRRNFQDAIISLLDNSSFHPTVNAIRQACGPYLQKMRSETRNFSSCARCYGNGQLDLLKIVNGSEVKFAIACPYCDAADMRGLSAAYFPRMSVEEFERQDQFEQRVKKSKLDSEQKMRIADLLNKKFTLEGE
jgi:hypothetical protein